MGTNPPQTRVTAQQAGLPWHRRTVTVVLALIFFFPVGLVLLWMRRDWSLRVRGVVTTLTGIFVIIAVATSNPQPATSQLGRTTSLGTTTTSSTAPPATAPSSPAESTAAVVLPSSPVTSAPPPTSAMPVTTTVAAAAPRPVTSTRAAQVSKAPVAPPPSTHSAPPPAPAPSTCGAPKNPYGYNFCGVGHTITNPHSDVCSYFNCIASFWDGRGYMVECADATYSMSGGISGACSHHGGVWRPVYSG